MFTVLRSNVDIQSQRTKNVRKTYQRRFVFTGLVSKDSKEILKKKVNIEKRKKGIHT